MHHTGIVSVITNEKYNLDTFYNSLISQKDKNFRLYFVDNNSTDGSAEYFKTLNKDSVLDVEYILMNNNAGFPRGSNAGAEKATEDGCRFILILNNDVEMESDCLYELRKLVDNNSNLVCAGMLLMKHKEHQPGIIQEYGGRIDFKKGIVHKYFENAELSRSNLPEFLETDFVGGGACFIKTDIFKQLGMFEELYFGYFDEIDLSYRLKVKNNYQMLVTKRAKAYHNHYTASAKKTDSRQKYYFEYYLSERNKFLYYDKFGLKGMKYRMLLTDLFKFPFRLMWFRKVCDTKLGMYYLRGMWDGLRGVKGKPEFVK